MAIGNNLSELAAFEILGVRADSSEYIAENFVKDSHYLEKKKKLPGAEIFGIKVIVDPDMECSEEILFPEKLARAKETIKKIKHWPPGFECCAEVDPEE